MTEKELDKLCKKFRNYECENQITIDEYLKSLENKTEVNETKGDDYNDFQL